MLKERLQEALEELEELRAAQQQAVPKAQHAQQAGRRPVAFGAEFKENL